LTETGQGDRRCSESKSNPSASSRHWPSLNAATFNIPNR
jgi:hypothetical protein